MTSSKVLNLLACFSYCLVGILSASTSNAQHPLSKEGIEDSLESVFNMRERNADSALYVANTLLALSKESNDKENTAYGMYVLGSLYLVQSNYQLADSLLHLAKSMFIGQGNANRTSMAMIEIGSVFYRTSNLDSAKFWYSKALEIKYEIEDKDGISILLNNLGNIEDLEGNYSNAMKLYMKALPIHIELGNRKMESNTYHNISILQYNMGEKHQAIRYQQKALQINQQLGNVLNEGFNHVALGSFYLELDSFLEAEFHARLAAQISRKLKSDYLATFSISLFGDLHGQQGRLDSSKYYFELFLDRFTDLSDPYSKAHVQLKLASVFSDLKMKIPEGLRISLDALDVFISMGTKKEIMHAHETLSKLYEHQNNNAKALYHAQQINILQDSIFETFKTKEYFELEKKYQTEQKESQIILLTKESQLQAAVVRQQKYAIAGTFVAFLSTLIIGLLLWRRNREKSRNNIVLSKKNSEIQELKNEVDHRARNQMNIALSLLDKHKHSALLAETKEIIGDYERRLYALAILSQLLSPESLASTIDLKNYLTIVISNVQFNADSFIGRPVDIDCNIAEVALDSKKSLLIALIITELITNSLKHAFVDVHDPKITIELMISSNRGIELRYSDNGSGLITKNKNGEGMHIIQQMTNQLHGTSQIIPLNRGFQYTCQFVA